MLEDSERERRGAMIEWPWKLRRGSKTDGPLTYELFHLQKDPFEKEDLSGKYPEVVQRIATRMDALKKDAPPAFWNKGDSKAPAGWKSDPIVGPDQE